MDYFCQFLVLDQVIIFCIVLVIVESNLFRISSSLRNLNITGVYMIIYVYVCAYASVYNLLM